MSSNDEQNTSTPGDLKESDCYTDLKTVGMVQNEEGEIFLIDNVNFGIKYKGSDKPLLPCNLPAGLQKEGKKIVFSGVIKEMKPEELWAGEPFVLTLARESH